MVVNSLLDSFSVVTSRASASWFNGDIKTIVAGDGACSVADDRARVAGWFLAVFHPMAPSLLDI